MPHTATVTAKTGAGQTATALPLSDIREIKFDCDKNVCDVTLRDGKVKHFAGYSTIALTVSGTTPGSTYALTLS